MNESGSQETEEVAEENEQKLVITSEDVDSKPAPASVPDRAESPAADVQKEEVEDLEPAGFWIRLMAKAVDVAIVMIPFAVGYAAVLLSASLVPEALPSVLAEDVVLTFLPAVVGAYLVCYLLYSTLSHAADGRTIGKLACGLRVLPAGDGPRGWEYHFTRFGVALWSLLFLGAGHLLAGFRQDKRALHDLVVGSKVVKE